MKPAPMPYLEATEDPPPSLDRRIHPSRYRVDPKPPEAPAQRERRVAAHAFRVALDLAAMGSRVDALRRELESLEHERAALVNLGRAIRRRRRKGGRK